MELEKWSAGHWNWRWWEMGRLGVGVGGCRLFREVLGPEARTRRPQTEALQPFYFFTSTIARCPSDTPTNTNITETKPTSLNLVQEVS